MQSKPSSPGEDQMIMKLVAGVSLALVIAYSLIPAGIAAGLFFLLRARLRRRDWCILLAGSLLALVAGGGSSLIGEYFHWMTRFFPPLSDVYLSVTSVVAVLTFSSLLLAVAGLLDGTAIAARLPALLRPKPLGEKPSIVPTDKERQRIAVVSPVAVDTSDVAAALVAQANPGHRPIVLGPGRDGNPVVVTEKELGTHALIFGSTGSGKALALDTPIPTPSGWTSMGALNVGDAVFDEHGRVCQVVFATETQYDHRCFDVTFDDGSVIVADADHRWVTTTRHDRTPTIRTTNELAASIDAVHVIPRTAGLCLPDLDLEADPYEIGCEIANLQPATLPPVLLRSSLGQRLGVLQGVVDVAGDWADGVFAVSCQHEGFAASVRELVRSCGFALHSAGGPIRFQSSTPVLADAIAELAPVHRIVSVTQTSSVPVRCIQVDSPSHLYLAGEAMVPTHNTETIKALAGGLLDLGWDGIILDLKEDTKPGGLRDWCETYADSHRIMYQELRLSDPNPRFWFDALSGLSQDEARDTILSLTRFDDEYYKNVSIKVLGQLLKLMYWANQVDPTACPLPTLYDIAHVLGAPSLTAATKKLRAIVQQSVPDLPKQEFQVLESPDQVSQNQAASWGAKLGNLYETQAGRLVLRQPGPTDRRQRLDVTSGGIMYIGLDSQGKPDLTKLVSSSVLQRISVEAAQRTTGNTKGAVKPKFLIVDEANWVDRTIVQNLLSRARSAGVAMVLCTQGPKDWIDKSGDDFARLAQNTNVAMIMKQGEPDAAQICADYIGNMTYKEVTVRLDDMGGSARDKVENIVSPDELRGLLVGEMILRVSSPRVRTEWVQVLMREPTANPPGTIAPRPPELGPSKGPGLARPPI